MVPKFSVVSAYGAEWLFSKTGTKIFIITTCNMQRGKIPDNAMNVTLKSLWRAM